MTKDWHILGAGAIGSLFAASMHNAGITTTLLCRRCSKRDHLGELCIERSGGTDELSLPVSFNDDPHAISHLLLTTKAYDVRTALSDIGHRLDHSSHIVILVNGMGFMEELRSDFPDFQFTAATTTAGSYRLNTNTETDQRHFCHAGNGLTRLGQTGQQEPPAWFSDWEELTLPCTWEENIEDCLWQKLAVNCAINPLSAMHRCKNGELATRPELSNLVRQLCDEIAQVSLAAGFRETSMEIHRLVKEVIRDTRNNRSSMLQDTLARRRTENDYISGYFLKVARQFNVETPANKAVFESISRLDQRGE
ncbi:MAG: 2-dehydropantoate 2-reductase [Proteobacteria bacterium]|nr:2-dehydropantoate 2-reductase [Pseudomonadota bacterium]